MEPKGLQSFKKAERITSKLLIDRLFNGEGSSMVVFPFRVVYIRIPKGDVPVSILVSVPKKRFHKAVDRNRMKRLTREAYRRQKQILWNAMEESDESIAIAFICIASSLCTYANVYKSMNKILTRIADIA
ncbi:MAG: ribonuclease P protein component [Bacteroidaceae bacterium]|nr:ribonuclease P protein component [Bacteroidaceae bacterium]